MDTGTRILIDVLFKLMNATNNVIIIKEHAFLRIMRYRVKV
jgi:hypothetical protein